MLDRLVRYRKPVTILLALIILVVIPMFRMPSYDFYPVGPNHYEVFHLSEQKTIGSTVFSQMVVDDQISGDRVTYLDPLVWLVSLFSLDEHFKAYLLVLVAVGLLSFILFYNLLDKHLEDKLAVLAISVFLIVSPLFTYIFLVSSESLYILLVMMLLTAFVSRSKISNIFVILLYVFISFFGAIHLIIALLSLFAFSNLIKQKTRWLYIIIIFTSVLFVLGLLGFKPFLEILNLDISLVNMVSGFGQLQGISIVNLLLAIFGLSFTWKNKSKHYVSYFIFLLGFSSIMIYFRDFVFVLLFPLSIFSGISIVHLIRREWSLDVIKKVTLFIILLSLLFVNLSYLRLLMDSEPEPGLITTLSWLSKQDLAEGVVLSDPKYSSYIKYFTNNTVLLDVYSSMIDHDIVNDTEEIFSSQNYDRTIGLLEKHNVSYLVFTPSMKAENWIQPDDGLLFVLSNPTFDQIFESKGYDVWHVEKIE